MFQGQRLTWIDLKKILLNATSRRHVQIRQFFISQNYELGKPLDGVFTMPSSCLRSRFQIFCYNLWIKVSLSTKNNIGLTM